MSRTIEYIKDLQEENVELQAEAEKWKALAAKVMGIQLGEVSEFAHFNQEQEFPEKGIIKKKIKEGETVEELFFISLKDGKPRAEDLYKNWEFSIEDQNEFGGGETKVAFQERSKGIGIARYFKMDLFETMSAEDLADIIVQDMSAHVHKAIIEYKKGLKKKDEGLAPWVALNNYEAMASRIAEMTQKKVEEELSRAVSIEWENVHRLKEQDPEGIPGAIDRSWYEAKFAERLQTAPRSQIPGFENTLLP